jgi:hypothetical protein
MSRVKTVLALLLHDVRRFLLLSIFATATLSFSAFAMGGASGCPGEMSVPVRPTTAIVAP